MATEYKLSYTASDINQRLAKTDLIDRKADLVNGKIPLSQLPDSINADVDWDGVNNRPTDLSDFTNNAGYLKASDIPSEYVTENELTNKGYITNQALSGYVKDTDLKAVAKTGKYESLDGIPTEFKPAIHEHDSLYYTESEIDDKLSNINTQLNNLNDNKASNDAVRELGNSTQKISNRVETITSTSTHSQYPSAKAVYNALELKQNNLTIEHEIKNSNNPVSASAVKDAVDMIIGVANGKCKTHVVDYHESLLIKLTGKDSNGNTVENEAQAEDRLAFLAGLNNGDIFLIVELNVPDYWWEKQSGSTPLSTQDPRDIVVSGYGAARILETTKVKLDDYAKTEDIPENLSELKEDDNHMLVTRAEKQLWSAKSDFDGNYNSLDNKPDKLPADGGNADTVGGINKDGFLRVSDSLSGYTLRIGTTGAAGYITFVV